MTDTFEAPAIETPATAQVVPPSEAPVEPVEEEKQVETPEVPEFTRKQHEKAIQEAKAKVERKFEREYRSKLEAENQALRQQNQPKVETSGKPERQAYAGDDERFIEDLTSWKAKQEIDKTLFEREQRHTQSENQRSFDKIKDDYEKRAEEVRKSTPDYDDLVRNEDLHINQAMAEAIALSEQGPKIALYLGRNPEESYRISRLHPSSAAYELGKLESKLASVPAKKISNAPAPITSVGSSKSYIVDLEKASQADFEKAMKKSGSRYVR